MGYETNLASAQAKEKAQAKDLAQKKKARILEIKRSARKEME